MMETDGEMQGMTGGRDQQDVIFAQRREQEGDFSTPRSLFCDSYGEGKLKENENLEGIKSFHLSR